MSYIEEHCKDCVEELGEPFYEVHAFLDQYSEMFPITHFAAYHRTFLHNTYGLRLVKAMWGEKAWKAAVLHVVTDYRPRPTGMGISIDWALKVIPSVLKFMNVFDFDGADPQIPQPVMIGWKDKGLVTVATEEV